MLLNECREKLKELQSEERNSLRDKLVETFPAFLVVIDKDGKAIWMNDPMLKALGYTSEEIKGVDYLSTFVPDEDRKKLSKIFETLVKEKKSTVNENHIVSRDGRQFLVRWSGAPIVDRKTGEVNYFFGIGIDITELHEFEEALYKSQERYRSLFENSIDGIYISTPEGKYIDANHALVKMLGYSSKEELLSVNTQDLYVSPKNRPGPKDRDRIFETRLKRKDGSKIWVEISSRVLYDNNGQKPIYYLGIVRDISERIRAERKIRYLSFHDSLTGLYNRAYFVEELKRLDTPRQLPLSFIIGDVNGLKLINDAFGHKEGDRLLRSVARILKNSCRKEDIIARWGGDEFSILLPNTSDKDAQEIIDRIKESCNKHSCYRIPITIALGSTTKIVPSQDVNELIKSAEDKMYRIKLLESKTTSEFVLDSLKKLLWEKSSETKGHLRRIEKMALELGKAINLPETELERLKLLSSLHDIGKVAIPSKILSKKGKLSVKEWEVVKRHSEIGYNIVQFSPKTNSVAEEILCHHEWWNGSGYPQGLKGTQIPLLSRIISIVDAYDAMTHKRSYREKITRQEAISELVRLAGVQFDPQLVNKFVEVIQRTSK
ncbi:MAG: PAS domain S-box protein [Actinobacteria bacterium]|nr:PAS domain S-box protein [Actinomycetota bacterium]